MITPTLHQAENEAALKIASQHYENFPVSPFFFPKNIRQPIALIYAFARFADDIADEGQMTPPQRLNALQNMQNQLDHARHTPLDPFFIALHDMIKTHHLPIELFSDLLKAFTQDCTKNRYHHFQEVLDYCRYSANPIGRLVLYLTGNFTPENAQYSDKICTALQLINFLQDFNEDFKKRNRIYLPLPELHEYGITEEIIAFQKYHANLQTLMLLQLNRIKTLASEGRPLTRKLKGWSGLDIRLIIAALQQMILLLHKRSDPYQRPRLHKKDWIKIITVAITSPAFQLI